jgi:hypothetical protein
MRTAIMARHEKEQEKEKEGGAMEEEGQGGGAADEQPEVDEEGSVTQGVENDLNEEQIATSRASSPAAARPASRAGSAGGALEEFQVRRKRIRH